MRASRSGPTFSHLFFVDDLVLFAKADIKNCTSVGDTLDFFYELSGQKISLNKSKVYFSLNINQDSREELYEVLGIISTPNLGKHLVFPLKDPSLTSQNFKFCGGKSVEQTTRMESQFVIYGRKSGFVTSCHLSHPLLCDARVYPTYPSFEQHR